MTDNKIRHGGRVFEASEMLHSEENEILDFSANISPFGLDERIKDELTKSTDKLVYYPETKYRKLTKKISALKEINESFIRCGNGATDIIYKLANIFSVFCKKGEKAKIVFCHPGFTEYESSFLAYETEKTAYVMNKDSMRVERDILDLLTGDVTALYICNPNNPCACLIDKAVLSEILEECIKKNIYLVLDECFMDFVKDESNSLVNRVEACSRLIILHSFTKLFAIPGLRLGYMLCSDSMILEKFDALSPTWNINTPAFLAGLRAIDLYDEIRAANLFYLEKERRYLSEELEGLGFKVYKSHTNFILFCLKNEKKDLESFLLKRKILIRCCADFYSLDKSYYRIAIRTREDNRRLIKGLKEYFYEGYDGFGDDVKFGKELCDRRTFKST